MGRTAPRSAQCPRCGREVRTDDGRYVLHNSGDLGDVCAMSLQHIPIVGESETAYISRAKLVANLAAQVQDADPSVVWDYLTALPGNELQRLTMIALAAMPIDQTLEDMFAWVYELPVAKVVA
jgi:hypothetical protein